MSITFSVHVTALWEQVVPFLHFSSDNSENVQAGLHVAVRQVSCVHVALRDFQMLGLACV